MLGLRLKKILFFLVFISIFSIFSLWGSEIDVPLPADTILGFEKNVDIGFTKSNIKSCSTSLSKDRLVKFFDKEMINASWRKERDNYFMKDDYSCVIIVLPSVKKDNKTQFFVTTCKMPKNEEIAASRKTNPDKVNFMPIYPGSIQNFFWNLPTGAAASYGTENGIKEVVFFYKSGMLDYGWSLVNEIPIKTEKIHCPECEKKMENLPEGPPKFQIKGLISRTSLVFRRGDEEYCKLDLYQNDFDPRGDPALAASSQDSSSKTTILVTYYAVKKNSI